MTAFLARNHRELRFMLHSPWKSLSGAPGNDRATAYAGTTIWIDDRRRNEVSGPGLLQRLFNSRPTQCLLPVGEGPHPDRLAVAYGVDVGKPHVLPLVAVFGSDPGVNEDHDSVSGGDESFGFAACLGPGSSRLGQISLHGFPSVVGAAAGKLRRLAPIDLRIE